MKKLISIIFLLAVFTTGLTAQVLKPVKWQFSQKKVSAGIYDIVCTASIETNWHLYDVKLPENGPLPTTFNIDEDESSGVEKLGEFKATTKPSVEHSKAFNMDLKYFSTKVILIQRVKVTGAKGKLIGNVEFMACSGDQCIPPSEADFKFDLTK